MERRVSRKRKSTSSNIRSKCVYSESSKKHNSMVLPVDFNSETLSSSSPIKPDKIEKTKVRRKKIRSTQDFNQFNSSLTSQESDKSTKSETKKTRKRNKDVYILPKIDNLIVHPFASKENRALDLSLNRNVHQKKESKGKKSSTRKQAKISPFKEYETSSLNNENVIKEKAKKHLKHKKNSSKDSSDEYQTAASISDTNRDSEVEFKLKKLGKKRDSSDMIETDRDEHYGKRIRKMFLNDCGESSDNDHSSNLQRSLLEGEFSEKSSSRKNQQTGDTEKIRKSKRLTNILTTSHKYEEQNNGKHLDINSSSHVSDEFSEQGKYVRRRTNLTEKLRKSMRTGSRKSSMGQNMSNHFVKIKEATKDCSTDNSLEDFTLKISDDKSLKSREDVSYILSNDDADVSDDVFDTEKEFAENIQPNETFNADKSELTKSTKKQIRKSVRFASLTAAEDDIDIRRSTFDVDKCTESINLFHEKSVEKPSNIMSKINSGIDKLEILNTKIGSSSISGMINLSMNIETPQEKSLVYDSVTESSKLNATFELSSSKHLSASPKLLDERNPMELLSPIYGKYPMKCTDSFSPNDKVCYMEKSLSNSTMINSQIDSNVASNVEKNGSRIKEFTRDSSQIFTCSRSLIDLTTPHVKKLRKSSDVILISSTENSLENSMKHRSNKLHRESTFTKEEVLNDEQIIKKRNGLTDNDNLCILKDKLDKNVENNPLHVEKELSNSGFIKGDSIEIVKRPLFKPITPVAFKKLFRDSMLVTESSEKGIQHHFPRNFPKISFNKTLNTTFDCDKPDGNSKINSLENDGNVQTTVKPKLNRTATFTKEDQDNVYKINTTSDVQSPLMYHSPPRLVDTSKVTKRKQWDKSQLSMSFLESSLDIGNTSAPWREVTINNTLEKSEAEAIHPLELEKSKEWYKKCVTPPSGTSTPFLNRKNDLLKKVLLKEKNVTINDSKNLSKSSSKPIVKPTRSKMPNFALIHQRAYDKLESLKEMSERKAQRAKLLLSGHKPDKTGNMDTSSKSKKFLQFSPAKAKKIPLRTSTKSNEGGKEVVLTVANISITKIKNITPSKSNPKVVAKENKITPIMKKKELLKAKSRIPTKVPNNVVAEKKGFTRYGFKIASKEVRKTTKEEQLKAITSKTKVVKNTVDQRRNVIQGVRSNRRFELLMSLRNK